MTRRSDPPRGLGRGLSALLGEPGPIATEAPGGGSGGETRPTPGGVEMLDIDLVVPNPDQPRRRFDEAELDELAASIRSHGMLQPIIVRPDPAAPGRFQIVAGERRWRAAQRAPLHRIPAVLRDFDDRVTLEVALIENVQRADLNPIDEARGYAQLVESFGYTQEALARTVGKSRSHLANLLRLLALPEEIQDMVRDGRLSAGHARALATAPDPVALARDTVSQSLSVRDVEARARIARSAPRGTAPGAGGARTGARTDGREAKDADTRLLEGDLSAALGMAVQISHGSAGEGGEMRIRYRSLDDLDRLCERLAR